MWRRLRRRYTAQKVNHGAEFAQALAHAKAAAIRQREIDAQWFEIFRQARLAEYDRSFR